MAVIIFSSEVSWECLSVPGGGGYLTKLIGEGGTYLSADWGGLPSSCRGGATLPRVGTTPLATRQAVCVIPWMNLSVLPSAITEGGNKSHQRILAFVLAKTQVTAQVREANTTWWQPTGKFKPTSPSVFSSQGGRLLKQFLPCAASIGESSSYPACSRLWTQTTQKYSYTAATEVFYIFTSATSTQLSSPSLALNTSVLYSPHLPAWQSKYTSHTCNTAEYYRQNRIPALIPQEYHKHHD